MCLSVAAMAAGAAAWQHTRNEQAAVSAELARLRAEPAPLAAAHAAPPPTDFARSLGAPLPASQVVQELQRACTETGIVLAAVQAQDRAPTAEQLGRLELAIHLRGGYAGTKRVLKQVSDRYPQLTVQRLRMRRGANVNELETQVTLSLWSAPLVAEGR